MKRRKAKSVAVHAGMLITALIWFVPIYWIISVSLRPLGETFRPTLFPTEINLAAYLSILTERGLQRPFLNSLIVSLGTTLIALFLSLPAAYALSRFFPRIQKTLSVYVIGTRMFPPVLLSVAYFFILARIKLYDTLIAIILMDTIVILPFILLMMTNYINSVPVEVDEAARIDGAGPLKTLIKVVLPITFPGLAATSVYGFLMTWNEFFFAFIFTQSEFKRVVPVELMAYQGQYYTDYQSMLAVSVLFVIPIFILFVIMQKYLIEGLAAGAVK